MWKVGDNIRIKFGYLFLEGKVTLLTQKKKQQDLPVWYLIEVIRGNVDDTFTPKEAGPTWFNDLINDTIGGDPYSLNKNKRYAWISSYASNVKKVPNRYLLMETE